MSTNTDNDTTYCIETNISAGQVKDPVTDETHDVDATSDTTGEIEVRNPYSARTIVDESPGFEFAESGPSEKAVTDAQEDALGFEATDLVLGFAQSRNKTVGKQTLAPSRGFDPETDGVTNGKQMKAVNVYEHLNEQGYEAEAKYLRALPSQTRQDQFCTFLRDEHGIEA